MKNYQAILCTIVATTSFNTVYACEACDSAYIEPDQTFLSQTDQSLDDQSLQDVKARILNIYKRDKPRKPN